MTCETKCPAETQLPADLSEHRVLNSAQAAKLCGIHVVTLRKLSRSGGAPAPVRIGARRYGWKAGELNAWLEAKRAAPDLAA